MHPSLGRRYQATAAVKWATELGPTARLNAHNLQPSGGVARLIGLSGIQSCRKPLPAPSTAPLRTLEGCLQSSAAFLLPPCWSHPTLPHQASDSSGCFPIWLILASWSRWADVGACIRRKVRPVLDGGPGRSCRESDAVEGCYTYLETYSNSAPEQGCSILVDPSGFGVSSVECVVPSLSVSQMYRLRPLLFLVCPYRPREIA